MVGFLKDSLNDTKALLDQRKTGSIYGFVYAIMVFALERFACVREELSLTPPAKKIPLMLAWMDVLSKAPVNGTRIETFRDLLQNMKRDEVVWQPYHDFGELSDEFKDQLSMIYLRVPCICFNVVAYNRPDKCFRQLGLKKSELQRLSRSRSKHTKVKFSQHKGQDWRAVRPFYRKVNEEWDNHHNYSVRKSEAPQQALSDFMTTLAPNGSPFQVRLRFECGSDVIWERCD
ncbi:Aminotransferase-like plant mobile domain [Arabidopsis thaliana x Arabidopsis arenosa]|uniref:Aminotransferase-like plant mobile domain n=1 Tax=Arabidopsis thaliana x Arabidopsis arenosa TaxID=1240361 RepID=A0A8T1ZGS3_9BRAS|nr:Aminotransferase-like plant mobile domain [Arabidopsis thaliana x Arabidopsis arenosa]